MTRLYVSKGLFPASYFAATVDYICDVQHADGAIPWYDGGHVDPWNHVEAAMGLSIGGRRIEAERAYDWLAAQQRRDGAWLASLRSDNGDAARHIETNFVAYVATGVWHHYRIYGDAHFLSAMAPVVERAMAYVLALQSRDGEIYWAEHLDNGVSEDALLTGCSSIYKSLECAACIACETGVDPRIYLAARRQLGDALRNRPDLFDRSWKSKQRYAMDWFYPVLTGVLHGAPARRRLHEHWQTYVKPGLGCHCVNDEPWVTVAESCELTMALLAAGHTHKAVEVFSWLHDLRHADGSWWMGYQYVLPELWPAERPTWTAGAVLLAADALAHHTRAHDLFTSKALSASLQHAERLDARQLGEKP